MCHPLDLNDHVGHVVTGNLKKNERKRWEGVCFKRGGVWDEIWTWYPKNFRHDLHALLSAPSLTYPKLSTPMK